MRRRIEIYRKQRERERDASTARLNRGIDEDLNNLLCEEYGERGREEL